ncbi:MAG: class I SAM-dependent methyltransferase [Holosporales bacterium]|jgi:2-polyprenyl-3-methyl-5-hydroxy-6-metoxy-1,4-benzoquinol methylase|nr:class I SAM-dependent methyltransferase [Holosporales bacterium]
MSKINTLDYGKYNSKPFLYNVSLSKRKEIFSKLASLVDFSDLDSVLDVGASGDINHVENNFFEELYPQKKHITALSDQDASWMEQRYPGLKFVLGDAREMPFPDNSFDLVFSSAVIEHVGSFEMQQKFLEECCRVSKKYVFLTTPNRWYPIEFHTVLPFIHWLPRNIHRKLLSALKYGSFASEENLNLLGYSDLAMLVGNAFHESKAKQGNWSIFNIKLLQIISNFILLIKLE